MFLNPKEILEEYKKGSNFKASLGSKGIYEQTKINERFFIGDQWYGAKCGNDRPLVRHNIIKRIGNYKMSQILGSPISVNYSADGVPTESFDSKTFEISGDNPNNSEINFIMSAFDSYYKTTSERVKLIDLNERILRKAYISGSAVLYTYWDASVPTGLYSDKDKKVKLNGDISCEVLDIEDIVFGDPFCEELQKQPFIIIGSNQDVEAVTREARLHGADISRLSAINDGARDSKIKVYTKLYKEYKQGGDYTIKCVKVTENAVVREAFDTNLRLYPLAIFTWDRKNNLIYGESEITYLIPNQIAINRMITANVWSGMTTGMPIMLVNGDTVTDKITNEPGQIIKVYGNNEDVEGAVKYVTPQSFAEEFDKSINSLIENTLTQSGANEVALGDSKADNASALAAMRDAALMPLQIIKNRFYTFTEDVARIWADFWITHYGNRYLKTKDKNGTRYISFDADRYKELVINTRVDVSNTAVYNEREITQMLITLFEKGIIDKTQLLTRLPDGIVPNLKGILLDCEGERENERI